MKIIFKTIIAVTMFTFTSCKKEVAKEATLQPAVVETPAKPAAEATPSFEPFQIMAVTHTVKNYDVWKKGFDEDEPNRVASGLTLRALARGMDNPNKVYIFLNVTDMQKAKDFATSPKLKNVMQKLGVIGKPEIIYSNVVRFAESPAEMKGRVRIAFKVKDFDAWLKVYDAEGSKTRVEHGFIDRAIARSIEDSNMIYLTFAISDLEKVKARLKSPELQKIMTNSGVISTPVTDFYTSV
ncbi:hypothetical protein [Flavobacterium sp.]|uniref:hypothetical protein n=1 Tax=Flavobacterium sp. TaxID=239 RepID=UPI0025EC167C|nr:hypothetical protein [Flavobacterium sp.]